MRRKRWLRSRLVFVDESGVDTSMTRAEAWAPRSERAIDHVPGRRWEAHTVIAALRVDGLCAPMLLPGAMNSEALRVWVRDCLCQELRRGDIVTWDNLGIHRDPEIEQYIRARRAALEFLPPYSPELNPIELAWAEVKAPMRRLRPRDWNGVLEGLGQALSASHRNASTGSATPDTCA
ncbi:MAG TPA: IS630 family transposase [Burkholderiales bacterium]|nr:IS630 family transposase [Burkholderiales bacterium]